jgi:hypothetical protein
MSTTKTKLTKTQAAAVEKIRGGDIVNQGWANGAGGERAADWLAEHPHAWVDAMFDGQYPAREGETRPIYEYLFVTPSETPKDLALLGVWLNADEAGYDQFTDQDASPLKGEFLSLWWD